MLGGSYLQIFPGWPWLCNVAIDMTKESINYLGNPVQLTHVTVSLDMVELPRRVSVNALHCNIRVVCEQTAMRLVAYFIGYCGSASLHNGFCTIWQMLFCS